MEGTLPRVANGNAPVWALGHTEYLQYSDSLESEHRFVSEILQANPFEVLMLLMRATRAPPVPVQQPGDLAFSQQMLLFIHEMKQNCLHRFHSFSPPLRKQPVGLSG